MESTSTERRSLTTRYIIGWLVLQLCIAAGGLVWAKTRWNEIQTLKALPTPQMEPQQFRPLYDVPELISDEDLRFVLWKLRPRLREPNPKINYVDHALRFWGVPSQFEDPACYSGVEMRELLLDHRKFRAAWADEGTRPLFVAREKGVKPRVQQGDATTSHVDHTLGTLSEVGTPLDYPIITSQGETTVRALLNQSLYEFTMNQPEYEWSILAYALYLPPTKSWVTQEGQKMNFDRLSARLLREKLTRGVCFGNHRLFTLAMLLRVDERQDILSDETRQSIVEHLKMVTGKLIATQNAEGFWDESWDGSPQSSSSQTLSPIARKILATGHALEWWAMAPADVLPPLEVRMRAATWLVHTIAEMSDREITLNYTFLTHAGRALALWRSKFPHEVFPDALCPAIMPERQHAENQDNPGEAK
ncbi:MAG: hypothetical protein ACKVT0_23360 [Planctomycetaceae bacterium]